MMNKVNIYPDTDKEYQWLKDEGFVTHRHPNLPFEIEYDYDYWEADPSVGVSEEFEIHEVTYLGDTKHPIIPSWLQVRIEKDIKG